MSRKQELLKRHRRTKRWALLVGLLVLGAASWLLAWWLLPVALLLAWLVHEVWFADHLFYSPKTDYHYRFPDDCLKVSARLQNNHLQLEQEVDAQCTLILEVQLKATWLGRWFDPYVCLGDDRQDFERGVSGRRYLNLTGQNPHHLPITSRFCRVQGQTLLYVMPPADFRHSSLLVIAPHSDDAELAAFGLYSQAQQVTVVTLTQGEIEAEDYQKLGLSKAAAARLKGRLRTWDSLAIPLWGGVKQEHCVQLGYYCLQLPAMLQAPSELYGSRESGEMDTRTQRQFNALRLPGDDGRPCGENLIADLVALLERARPEAVVTPHPDLDPHPDHVAATQALLQAIERSSHKPKTLLLYANHLHDNDRWPMGPSGYGIALPPAIEPLPADPLWVLSLTQEQQLDKAMALAMQHDLQGRLSGKKALRRNLQRLLAGRRHPPYGDNEFFRKAVRRHELFWARSLSQ